MDTTRRFDSPSRPDLDPDRVQRARGLEAVRIGEGQYQVRGRTEDYFVELLPYFSCYCGDAVFRETVCKHLIAALLLEQDAEAVRLAASMDLPAPETPAAESPGEAGTSASGPDESGTAPATKDNEVNAAPRYDWAQESETEEEVVDVQPPDRVTLKGWW